MQFNWALYLLNHNQSNEQNMIITHGYHKQTKFMFKNSVCKFSHL